MVPKIDFSKLSLQDALDLAILIEEEAKDRYQEFVDQLELHHTPQAASFFRFMEDCQHEKWINWLLLKLPSASQRVNGVNTVFLNKNTVFSLDRTGRLEINIEDLLD